MWGEGGGSQDAESEDKYKDKYEGEYDCDYQDNSTIDVLWYKLQCDDVFAFGTRTLHNPTTWIDLCLVYKRTLGAKHSTLSSSTSSLRGDDGLSAPKLTVQLEVKGQDIVANELIWAGQWILKSHKMDRLLEAPSYRRFLWSIPVDLVCNVIQW